MKKGFFLVIVLMALVFAGKAQCDKKITWSATKTEFLDSSGNVQHEENNGVVIQTSSKEVIITPNSNEEEAIHGDVKDLVCDWKEAFKNGRTSFKSSLKDPRGDEKDGTVVIEGKDGKIVFLFDVSGADGRKFRIRVYIDSHQEEG